MKHAVDRNRLRRQVYGKYEQHLKNKDLGFDIICLYNSADSLHDTPRVDDVFRSFLGHLQKQKK